MTGSTIRVDRHQEAFSKRGFSLPEWYVLSIPGQWPVPKGELPQIAASQSIGDPRGKVNLRDCQVAFQQLVARGFLRVVGKSDLNELRRHVAREECGKPVNGYPRVGDVDFTKAGSEMFLALSDQLYGLYFFSEAVVEQNNHRRTVYTARKKRADEIVFEARKAREHQVLSVRPIGLWCIYWWKVFREGWQIELVKPNHRP